MDKNQKNKNQHGKNVITDKPLPGKSAMPDASPEPKVADKKTSTAKTGDKKSMK